MIYYTSSVNTLPMDMNRRTNIYNEEKVLNGGARKSDLSFFAFHVLLRSGFVEIRSITQAAEMAPAPTEFLGWGSSKKDRMTWKSRRRSRKRMGRMGKREPMPQALKFGPCGNPPPPE